MNSRRVSIQTMFYLNSKLVTNCYKTIRLFRTTSERQLTYIFTPGMAKLDSGGVFGKYPPSLENFPKYPPPPRIGARGPPPKANFGRKWRI